MIIRALLREIWRPDKVGKAYELYVWPDDDGALTCKMHPW